MAEKKECFVREGKEETTHKRSETDVSFFSLVRNKWE